MASQMTSWCQFHSSGVAGSMTGHIARTNQEKCRTLSRARMSARISGVSGRGCGGDSAATDYAVGCVVVGPDRISRIASVSASVAATSSGLPLVAVPTIRPFSYFGAGAPLVSMSST